MATTVVRDCDWIVAWIDGAHTYLRGGDVAWQDGVLAQVGGRWQGAADTAVSGRGRLVMPGLVDLHSHPSLEPAYRGVREEHGVRGHYMSGLYERSCAFWPDEAGQKAAAEVAYCELLLSGVTALADLSGPYDGWIELMARSGLRGFVAPWFASARWKLENDHDLQFTWAKDDGRAAFDRALALADEAGRHPSGRLSGVIFPAQIETCSPTLLKDAMAAALARKLPITTHASQSVNEFLEIVKRTGKTPVQYAADLGILHPSMTLAHCIFIDDHSWLHWRTHNDVALLAETGTSIAHCPTPFARYGAMLEDFGRYRRAGINLGVGTDTTPHNMIEEIRWAVILCKTASGDVHGTKLSDVFHAATVGGAKALLRDDIGRLAPGCRADLVLVDIDEPWMQPARDPLRSLVFHAADRAVRDVFVDGTQVVRDRTVLTLDRALALAQLAEAQARMLEAAPSRDYAHRRAEEIAPLTFPVHGH
jgi:cytosine/adenosine deaminase-related metal-dependent hydrolase